MTGTDGQRSEVEALHERLDKLSHAILRISESLDLDSVLQEVVDSACALTGARFGAVTTMDDAGGPQDFVTSGLTLDGHQQLLRLPRALYEDLRSIPTTIRFRNLSAHIVSLGHPRDLLSLKTYLGTPIRYRDAHVGNFYLVEKERGQEFTRADEDLLTLFASQAALAIANARRHREEQRARADLEALIDTSPVGVAVFDAKTGQAVSMNQEMQRVFGGVRVPSPPVADLLDRVTIRRADGNLIPPEEFPVARAIREATTVRAEQIVIQDPDGRHVTTLINATPIHGDGGAVESVVVTLQDMAPVEELERLRAEFLSMVSHELRAPLSAIRGLATTVLDAESSPHPAAVTQLFRIILEQADHMGSLVGDLLDAGRIETGRLSVSPEPAPLASLVEQARKTFLASGASNSIRIDLPPDLPEVLADGRRIVQVLDNLLGNASRHSPEASPIEIAATAGGTYVEVSVADRGEGVEPTLLPHLFRKHVRTGGSEETQGVRGSGLGLAICKGLVEAHGGRIWAESEGTGKGTRFTLTIPAAEASGTAAGPSAAGPRPGRSRAESEATRVLVVDDDPATLRSGQGALATTGYSPVLTGDPEEVPGLLKATRPHLVLLDLVLPGTDGIELMRSVPGLADVPVIFVSAYGRDETIARALDAGAADYVVKPFSPMELVARIRAALRRRAGVPRPFRLGDLSVNHAARRVSVGDRWVRLTATEYELLRELSTNAGRVMTYDTLLRRVWGIDESPDPRLVHSFVTKLRRKLGDDARSPSYILTEPRVGYLMPRGE